MATVSEALARPQTQIEFRLYIKNTSSTYVNFSDRFAEDRLFGSGNISHIAEGKYGHPITKNVTIKVDNSDRYWDQDAPSAYDPWEGRYVQLRIYVGDASEQTIATFKIAPDGIETNSGDTASITLEPLTETMARADASGFKQGTQKYQNRSWLALVKDLTRTEFGDASGDLPSSYEFPADPRFTFPDGNKHFSVWGKPPQWDGSSWNEDNTDTPRAIDYSTSEDVIYVGIGEDMWEYAVDTDTWTNDGEHASNGNGVDIKFIYDFGDAVVVCKWATSNVKYQTIYINVWVKSTDTWHSTTKGSYSDFAPGTWVEFDGVYKSGPAVTVKGRNDTDGYHEGTNLIVPFRQFLQWRGTGTGVAGLYPASGVHEDSSDTPIVYAEDQSVDAGHYYVKHSIKTKTEVRPAWGQRYGIDVYRVGTSHAHLYYTAYDNGYDKGNIYQVDINLGSSLSRTLCVNWADITTGRQFFSPRCAYGDGYITFIYFGEGVGSYAEDHTSVQYVSTSSMPNNKTELFSWDDIEADQYTYIIDILGMNYDSVGANFNRCYICVMEINQITGWPGYRLMLADDLDTTPTFTTIDNSGSYFRGPHAPLDNYDLVYVDTSTGTLKRLSGWQDTGISAPTTYSLLDNGKPPVYDAPFVADFVAAYDVNPNVYGLSFPFHPPETQISIPEGKYYLWQYTTKHTGRIELADFDDMNKLEAVSQICEAMHHVIYVASDGDWIVAPRDTTGTPSDTIGKCHFDNGWLDIKRLKSADVVNYVEWVPYESTLKEMDTTLFLKADSAFSGSVVATQLDTREKRIKLRCIKDALISSGNARLDWLSYYGSIDTRLGSAYTSGTSVVLESVWDVSVGDKIQVVDSEIREITAITESTKTVTIDSGFSSAYPILSPVQISKANQNKWSSQGLTLLNGAILYTDTEIDVDSVDDISVGNFIIVMDVASSPVMSEEMEVTAIDGYTLTVTRGTDPQNFADNSVVGVVVKPSGYGEWFEIGGHHISMCFDFGTGTEYAIRTGDYIECICPGMSMERRKGSKIIIGRQSSIAKVGKRKMRSTPDNRFLDAQLGDYKLNTYVDRYKGPTAKRRYQVIMPLNVDYQPKDIFYLESEDMFPDESGDKLAVIVQESHINPLKNQTVYIVEEQ